MQINQADLLILSKADTNSDFTQENKDKNQRGEEDISIATDEKFKTFKDSFELFLEKNSFEPNKEAIYKYHNRLQFKIQKKRQELEGLKNKLIDLKRCSKKNDFTDQVNQVQQKYLQMKIKAKSMKYDVENYQHIVLRSFQEKDIMKQKVEELTQIYKSYDETMRKYQIISEVTERELQDINLRLNNAKQIFVKRIGHNDDQLINRQHLASKMEDSIQQKEKIKKINHKEGLLEELQLKHQREEEQLQRNKDEYIYNISQQLDQDLIKCEEKYKNLKEKLGTDQIQEIQIKIQSEVIPFDIQKQSLENIMRDRLQSIGLLQGKKQSLLLELQKAKEEYERKYQEEEFYTICKIQENKTKTSELNKQKDFYQEQNEKLLKSLNQVLNQMDAMNNMIAQKGKGLVVEVNYKQQSLISKVTFFESQLIKVLNVTASYFRLISSDQEQGSLQRQSTTLKRRLVKNLQNCQKKVILSQLSQSQDENSLCLKIVKIENDNVIQSSFNQWKLMTQQVDPNEIRYMRKTIEQMIYEQEDDSEMDEEMIAHKTKAKLENEEQSRKKLKKTPTAIFKRGKLVVEEVDSDQEEYFTEQRKQIKEENIDDFVKTKERKKQRQQNNVIFGIDEYIMNNKDIKRKWFIQNLSNLRKAEKRCRKVYLQMEFQDLKGFEQGEHYFEDQLYIGKSPDEIVKKKKQKKTKENDQSKTLSLSSEFKIETCDKSLEEINVLRHVKTLKNGFDNSNNNQNLLNDICNFQQNNVIQKNNIQKSPIQKSQSQQNLKFSINKEIKPNKKQDEQNKQVQEVNKKEQPQPNQQQNINNKDKGKQVKRKLVISSSPGKSRSLLQEKYLSQKPTQEKRLETEPTQPKKHDLINIKSQSILVQSRVQTSQNTRSVANLNAYKFHQIKDFMKTQKLSFIAKRDSQNTQLQSPKSIIDQLSSTQQESKNEVISQNQEAMFEKINNNHQKQGPYQNSIFKLQNIYKLHKPQRRNIEKIIQREVFIKITQDIQKDSEK